MVAPRCSPRSSTPSRVPGTGISCTSRRDPTTGSTFEAVPGKLGEWRPSPAAVSRCIWPIWTATVCRTSSEPRSAAEEPWSYRLNTGASGANRFAPKVETNIQRNIAFGNFAVDTDGDGRTELISADNAPADPGWASWGLSAAGGGARSGW